MFALNQTTTVTHTFGPAVQTGAVDLFRLTFPIIFQLDGAARELVFDAAGCAINARFLTLESGTAPNITVHYPTNPMLGIAPQNSPGDAYYFFSATGELGASKGEDHPAGAPLSSGVTTDKQAFIEALQNVGNRLLAEAESAPAQLTLLLIAESNARCRLQIDTLKVAYRRAYVALLSGATDKQVLKFDPARAGAQSLALQKPPGPAIHSAQLELFAKPAGASALKTLAADASGGGEPFEPEAIPAQKFGLRIEPAAGAAQPIALTQAQIVQGVTLALLPLTAGSALSVSIEADKGGRPGGAPLAEQELRPGAPGRPGWYTALFPASPLLSTGPHWLVLRAGKGAVVWLSAADGLLPGGVAAGDGRFSTLRLNQPAAALLHRWLGNAAGSAGNTESALPPQNGDAPALRVRLGEHELPLLSVEKQTYRFDLQPALTALAGGSSATAPLAVMGIGFDLVTVYPPRIVYDG